MRFVLRTQALAFDFAPGCRSSRVKASVRPLVAPYAHHTPSQYRASRSTICYLSTAHREARYPIPVPGFS
eukprot:1559883-Rhodomonas_salina.1